MKSHPGGEEHTRRMLELAELPEGASVLDMGAGAGESLSLMRSKGFDVKGLDIEPRSSIVEPGDFLRMGFPDESFDAVLSQCAFFISGDQPGALREAFRVLRNGGKLLLSDVFFSAPEELLRNTGFELVYNEDMTELWREYYLEALWRDDAQCCEIPKGRCSYNLVIGRKDGYHGSF